MSSINEEKVKGEPRVSQIFCDAQKLPPTERKAFLDQAFAEDLNQRKEVESLLAADELGQRAMPTPIPGPGATTPPPMGTTPEEAIPKIRGYTDLKRIGEGGMGAVWEAMQDQPHRSVALKVIKVGKASPQALLRFQKEAEVLGRLHHPCIAHIYVADAVGSDGGQPYLVMELIRGANPKAYAPSLTKYSELKRLAVNDRLELLARVAEAVEYAHQNSVIHCDLKPDNILVDERGEPKVLDFGIARLKDPSVQLNSLETRTGPIIGTPEYMAPEQAAGHTDEIDEQSDVYALGVICFELLTRRRPYDIEGCSPDEVIRRIRNEVPPRLRSIDKSLRGDVEPIVAKALAKEKKQRYQSAIELAVDIRRYLRGETVLARPESILYSLQKWTSRHQYPVVAAALAVVAIIAGTIIYLVSVTAERDRAESANLEAQRQTQRSQYNLVRANEQRALAFHLIDDLMSDISGSDVPLSVQRELLNGTSTRRVIANLQNDSDFDPQLSGDLLVLRSAGRWGALHVLEGKYTDAEREYREALTGFQRRLHEQPTDHGRRSDTAIAMVRLARLWTLLGQKQNLDEGESMLREALKLLNDPAGNPASADTLSDLAATHLALANLLVLRKDASAINEYKVAIAACPTGSRPWAVCADAFAASILRMNDKQQLLPARDKVGLAAMMLEFPTTRPASTRVAKPQLARTLTHQAELQLLLDDDSAALGSASAAALLANEDIEISSDRIDWQEDLAAALVVQGECLQRHGETDKAKAAFARASATLDGIRGVAPLTPSQARLRKSVPDS